jgi:hypothetical protein
LSRFLLVDLEWQLLRDEAAAGTAPRDDAIGAELRRSLGVDAATARQRLADDPAFRREVATRWLARAAPDAATRPGQRLERGQRVVAWLAGVLAILLGIGSAKAVLAYDGTRPVNVFWFIGVFFAAEILLLALLVWVILRGRRPGDEGPRGMVQAAIARLCRARFVGRLLGTPVEDLQQVVATLRQHGTLYADLERWSLFTATQWLAVLFNASALATCLLLIAFTDIAFGWSTTLDLDAAQVHRWMRILAAPWAWLDVAVPNLDVVQASRYDRMQGTFAGGQALPDAVRLAAHWWSFLCAGLLCWGLAPRVLAWGLGKLRARRLLHRAPLDHARFQRLYERLFPIGSGWSGPAPDAVGALPDGPAAPVDHAPIRAGGRVAVVAWGRLGAARDELARLVTGRFAASPAGSFAAGGRDLADDDAVAKALERDRPGVVAVVFEAGVQPTREIEGFLADLRRRLGPRAQLVVGLVVADADGRFVDADPGELTLWSQHLDRHGDAYLRVERMVPA